MGPGGAREVEWDQFRGVTGTRAGSSLGTAVRALVQLVQSTKLAGRSLSDSL